MDIQVALIYDGDTYVADMSKNGCSKCELYSVCQREDGHPVYRDTACHKMDFHMAHPFHKLKKLKKLKKETEETE